jgi:RHS repeat-associated protein
VGTDRADGARFYPYGEEIGSATANDRTKFASYSRDGFTGLDYADQRYYASVLGRFGTPDPYKPTTGPASPGDWNQYAYVGDDPVNYHDPRGLFALAAGDDDEPDPQVGAPLASALPSGQTKYDRSVTQTQQGRLRARISNLGDCTKILGGASAGNLTKIANGIQFFDGAIDAPGSGRSTSAAVTGASSTDSLASVVQGNIAVTLVDVAGNALPAVVLGQDFFHDQTVSQGDTLLHELLHVALNMDDSSLKAYLQQYGFIPQKYGGTNDITQWLKADCPSGGGK